MSTQPLCKQCQHQISEQPSAPHDQLREFANHEASTVDGGFSEHEYHCDACGHELRHINGIIMDGGWSEMP
ncbi:hypothetical protein [uncultured Ferrimonas sp.]|uniref:hypothetical protein n=1 Tax=uncultured Ferrimonas sp. TaxID=432640 RepID=UPI002602933B|nr:hypothetical protein [uncultured Ferrimonas sp.]